MADLEIQLGDHRLITAQIYYHLPDFQELLQEFIWQDYDVAPEFPALKDFLGFWQREIEGQLHSVYVGRQRLITSADCRFVEFEGVLH